MKKMLVWGTVALVMLALTGCDEGIKDAIIGKEPDKPTISGSWTKGLTDFEVKTGDQAGEIKYKFTATDPAADSYTLYYGTAGLNKAEQIILLNKTMTVTPQNDFTALSFTFSPGVSYSMVVEAKKGENDYARSVVISKVMAQDSPQLKVTVNGIGNAPTGKIWGASLLAPGDPSTPVAIGMQDASKAFVFYYPNAAATSPDFTKPFKTPSTYLLAIALADIATQKPEVIYMYNKNPITYTTSNTSITIDWDDFSESAPSVNSTVITITNIPATVTITALAVMDGITPKATAMVNNGIFALYEPTILGTPDNLKPWKGSGSYSITLLNGITPVASYFRITGGTTSSLYTFTGQETITLNYSTDFVAP